jgi:hypothetical protein
MYRLSDVLTHFKGVYVFFCNSHTTHTHVRNKRQYIILVKYTRTM